MPTGFLGAVKQTLFSCVVPVSFDLNHAFDDKFFFFGLEIALGKNLELGFFFTQAKKKLGTQTYNRYSIFLT